MEAKGIQWVIDASVATVEGCMGGIDTMQGYVPETNAELEVPEYIKRASAFYDVYQYTDERYQDVLDNKADQTKLYYKYMESERLSQYFNNMLFATASMVLPFGNKIKGAKLALHEGVTIISFAYSADRTYKGYELMQQVEAMDADSEANGLFNLENNEYGEYVIALGETCNLYTAASASNILEYKVFGKPVTISSNIATCGEEYISDKTNNLIYQITGEQNLITSVISGMVGNGFVNGVKLEIGDAGRLDIDPSVDYDVDFQNNSAIMDVDASDVPVKSVGEGGSKADLGNKLDYQFGNAGGNKHNVDRTTGLKAEMDKLGFDDTPENRAYFEQYYNDVLNDPSNIVGKPQTASYVENGVTYNYTVTTRESFLMGKYGGAKITTHWDGNRLLTIKIGSGKQTRYHH